MDVVPEWDTTMLDMWSRTENEYGMLTTYVHVQESIGSLATALDKTTLVPIICQVGFTSANNPRYEQVQKNSYINLFLLSAHLWCEALVLVSKY